MRIAMLEEFSRVGGGQELFIDVYSALKKNNDLFLVTGKEYPENLEFKGAIKTSYSYKEGMNIASIAFKALKLKRELKKLIDNYDLVYNNHPNIFLYKGDINYLHGFSFLDPIIDENGNIENRFIYNLIRLSKIYSIYDGARFLTHGKYTRDLSKKLFPYLGIRPKSIDFIFIPVREMVDVDLSMKKDYVLTFGRINKFKDLDKIIDTAKRMKNIKFIIAGAVNKGDEQYAQNLERNAPENVKIVKNPSADEKISLFSNARVYLHTKKKEHYGITVAEAVSFGCIPVVPKSGGPWIDIVEEGKYGIGYDAEPDESILQAFNSGINFAKEILDSRYRFSFNIFKEKINDYFNNVAEEKGIKVKK